MTDLVVNSKNGRRSLMEIPPMQPVYQRYDMPDALHTNPQDHYSIYPPQVQGISMHPKPSAVIPGEYDRPLVTYHQQEGGVPVCRCCGDGRHGIPYSQRSEVAPQDYWQKYMGLHNPSVRAPDGYYPRTIHRPSYPIQETHPYQRPPLHQHIYQRPATEQFRQYNPQYNDLPPKPKSAHYFYGPNGELLPGPLDVHKRPETPKKRIRHSIQGDRELEPTSEQTAQDFLVEATLRYGKIKTVTVKHASPSFKTLPEMLIDELENHYSGIPETHVVLVAVNDNYSVYATPYAQGTPCASSFHAPHGRQRAHSSGSGDHSFR